MADTLLGSEAHVVSALTGAARARVEGRKDATASLEHALAALDERDLGMISTATGLLERMLP